MDNSGNEFNFNDIAQWSRPAATGVRSLTGGSAGIAPRPNASFQPAGDAQNALALQGVQNNYLKQTKERYQKMMGLAQQFGASQLANNQVQLRQDQAAGNQQLTSRGLGNSSVVQAVNQNAGDLAQRRSMQIGEQQAQLQMGVLDNTQIQPPDLSLYAQLFAAPRTGGGPLIPSQNQFDLFSPTAPAGKRKV